MAFSHLNSSLFSWTLGILSPSFCTDNGKRLPKTSSPKRPAFDPLVRDLPTNPYALCGVTSSQLSVIKAACNSVAALYPSIKVMLSGSTFSRSKKESDVFLDPDRWYLMTSLARYFYNSIKYLQERMFQRKILLTDSARSAECWSLRSPIFVSRRLQSMTLLVTWWHLDEI